MPEPHLPFVETFSVELGAAEERVEVDDDRIELDEDRIELDDDRIELEDDLIELEELRVETESVDILHVPKASWQPVPQ